MRVRLMNFKTLRIVAVLGIAAFFASCTSEGGKTETTVEDTATVAQDKQIKEQILGKAKKVMISLPSPIETNQLIKRAGAVFNEDLLNPTEKTSNYSTNKSMALNMGVYGADLSYASVFNQSQPVMHYMAASKKLADQLGLLHSIDNAIVERLETNISNRDSIIRIISETFMNSNSTLQEDDRPQIAALILAGGWIEGLYLATSLAEDLQQTELIERIVDQRLSLNELVKLLEMYEDHADIASVLADVKGIEAIFAEIQVEVSKVEPVTDQAAKTTTLVATSKHSLTQEQFDKLKAEALKVRTKIVE